MQRSPRTGQGKEPGLRKELGFTATQRPRKLVWRMRGAGRGVVNGASCLPEFEAGGRARRRRGGAGAGRGVGVGGGRARGAARGSGGRSRGRLELCLRGREATAEAGGGSVGWAQADGRTSDSLEREPTRAGS